MAELIPLDKTGYTDFKKKLPDDEGAMISVIQFNDKVEGSNTFFEYRGTLNRVTPVGVIFQSDAPLFYRFVSSGTTETPLRPSTEYYLKFYDFYTYMWTYTGGDTKERAISMISPEKSYGGKSRRKRKSRKSKLKYRKNGTR